MAIFASTTTSGYSDPLKAMSIKALEQRMKDQQAQAAAQQPDASLMATIPGGIGSVLGIVGDKMTAARNENAAAEGRNELAATIAQGPKGPDGNWAPEQLAVMARRSPDLMEKFYQQQHDLKYQGNQIGSTERVATADRGSREGIASGDRSSRESIATGDRTSREAIANSQQQGENARQAMQSGTQVEIAKIGDTGADRRQTSGQAHEARQTRLKADLDATAAELKYAQENKLQDRAATAQEKLAGLQSELRKSEASQASGFLDARQEKELSQNTEMKRLDRDLQAANLKLQLANQSGIASERVAAEKEIAEINNKATALRDEYKAKSSLEAQTQAEKATAGNVQAKILSDERIAAAAAAAKAADQASDPKRRGEVAGLGEKYARLHQSTEKLDKAVRILTEEGGINTGPWAKAETVAANLANGRFGTDKEMAQRTTAFNSLVNEATIQQMSDTLKGQTTNFEMEKFIEVMNNPNTSPEDRVAAIVRLRDAAKVGRDLTKDAFVGSGGKLDIIHQHIGGGAPAPAPGGGGAAAAAPAGGGGGVARPAGMDDAAILAEAQKSMANATPEQKAQIQQRLQSWGIKGP